MSEVRVVYAIPFIDECRGNGIAGVFSTRQKAEAYRLRCRRAADDACRACTISELPTPAELGDIEEVIVDEKAAWL